MIGIDADQAFVVFYRAVHPRVVSTVYPIVCDLAEAEDIAQEAFVRAARHWDQVRGYDLPEAWVRRVAINLALTWRRRSRLPVPLPVDHEPSVPGPGVEGLDLARALQSLPVRYRTVLTLRYLLDLTTAEIAEELDRPEATVRTWLARGRRRLAAELGDLPERHALAGVPARPTPVDGGTPPPRGTTTPRPSTAGPGRG